MANIVRKGYGQVEPNHLSGIVTGQIYAQLPAANVSGSGSNKTITPIAQLEQGQFAIYDYAAGVVHFTGDGEFMLVYNEEKHYDERQWRHKDFVYKTGDFTDAQLFPRLIRTYVGDIMTTNMIGAANTTGSDAKVTLGKDTDLVVGAYLAPDSNGILQVAQDKPQGMAWKIVKVYTMPDGQPGFKIQRVQ